jgi:hydroxymethylbilane synthase
MRLRVGTRGSLLARTQTGRVVAELQAAHPDLEIVTEIIQTTGDLRRDVPFAAVGTKGMFVKEIEQALLDNAIDLGVHSLKDMPGELPEGLVLACIPAREDPRDALIMKRGASLADLPQGAKVGTSSLRRQTQLRCYRPDLQIEELRGNLDTRLRKLEEGQIDAIVVACAGLNRMGWGHRITQALGPEICVPAAGQGALALEIRREDTATHSLLAPLHDAITADAVAAERAFLAALGGGCSVPAGAFARVTGSQIEVLAMIGAPDGSYLVRDSVSGSRDLAAVLGAMVAERLLQAGGRDLLKG